MEIEIVLVQNLFGLIFLGTRTLGELKVAQTILFHL